MTKIPNGRLTLERVLEALGREAGLTAKVLQWEPTFAWHTPLRPDALIQINGPERPEEYAVEVKTVDRFATLQQLRALWPRHAKPALLIAAPYITAQMAERCREMDLYFADAAGNVYLRGPGLHLYVTGKGKPAELGAEDLGKTANPTGLKLIFALLCKPELLNATYRELAAAARIALGAVGPIMAELQTRGQIALLPERGGTRRRRFVQALRLLQEWVTLYPTILRPKLHGRKFHAPEGWTNDADAGRYHVQWGGEVAANRLLHHLVPRTATLYAETTPKELIVERRMRADAHGDVEILDLFWNVKQIPAADDLVPPLLIYADLATATDGRNLEAAKRIYEQYLEPAFRNQT